MRKLVVTIITLSLLTLGLGDVSVSAQPLSLEDKVKELGLPSDLEVNLVSYFQDSISRGQLDEKSSLNLIRGMKNAEPKFKIAGALWLTMTPREAVCPWEFPAGTDIEEYMKGAPKKHYINAIGCVTGHYGSFLSSLLPVLLPSLFPVFSALPMVRGVPVALRLRDSRSNPAVGLSQYETFKTLKPYPTFMSIWDPDVMTTLAPRLKEDNIINNFITSATCQLTNYFEENSGGGCCQEEVVCDEIRYLMMERSKMEGKPCPTKFGVLLIDIPIYKDVIGGQVLPGKFVAQMKNEYGLEVVGYEIMGVTAPDCTPQLIKLRNAGAEFIFAGNTAGSCAVTAKCARALGMDKKIDFMHWTFGFDGTAAMLAGPLGPDNPCEEDYMGWLGVSGEEALGVEPYDTGRRIMNEIYEATGTKLSPINMVEDSNISSILPWWFDLPASCVDRFGGWSGFQKASSEDIVRVAKEEMAKFNHYTSAMCPTTFTTMIPGRFTSIENSIAQMKDGKTRCIRRPAGNFWEWVPPTVIKGPGPCPPHGWAPTPLDGTTIDYGEGWGVWTIDKFLAQYDVPLWWAIFTWAFNSDNKLDKDLLFKTLDKYFEAKKVSLDEDFIHLIPVDWSSPEKRVEKLTEFVEQYYLPDNWVEWINEYMDNQKSKIGGLV